MPELLIVTTQRPPLLQRAVRVIVLVLLWVLGSIALDEGAHAIYDHMKLRAYFGTAPDEPLPNTAMGLSAPEPRPEPAD